jgi:hypothetical protein
VVLVRLLQPTKAFKVNRQGAVAGSVLCGSGLNNRGLRLRVLHEQARGHDGALKGRFVILDVGDNTHSPYLAALLQRVTDAEEVAGIIRRHSRGCVNVANANILVVEQHRAVYQGENAMSNDNLK